MEIEEINERFHLDLPESDDYQTIAGYLLNENEAIPNVGEVLEFPPYRFTIERKTAARIELIRVDIIDWVKLPESIQKHIKKEHDVVQAASEG